MKKQFLLFMTITLLICGFAKLVSAQTPSSTPQVYQGCAAGPFTYKFPPKRFIWRERDARGRLKRSMIDEIVSSDFRMAFTFVPEKTVLVKNISLNSESSPSDKNNLLKLEVFSYGRETEFGKTDLQNPLTLKSLKLPPIAEMPEFKKSQLEEEDFQYVNWDGTPLETMKASGRWFAVIHRKSDFANGLVPNILPIISPTSYLDKNSIPIELIPPTLYKYRGKIVEVTGTYDQSNNEKPPSIPSAIRIIELIPDGSSNNRYNFTLDTTGLEKGDYYATLQGDATFDGQNPESCSKTTPPVVISVKNETIIERPALMLNPDVNCFPFRAEIIAKATDKNYPARKLTIKNWRLRDKEGREISPYDYNIESISESSQKLVVNKILEKGKYFVEATVSNGEYDTPTITEFEIIDCPPLSGSGAGIAYFGNATPNYRKGEIIRDPEEWTKNTEKRDKSPKKKYPDKEYKPFYLETKPDPSYYDYKTFDPNTDANTLTIDRIVAALKKYPESTLYILGYADYRATRTKSFIYRNDLLAEFRVRSVVQVLRDKLISEKLSPERIIGADTTFFNCSDKTATVNKKLEIWSETLRWDRRVEIIFAYGQERPKRPNYAEVCETTEIDLSR